VGESKDKTIEEKNEKIGVVSEGYNLIMLRESQNIGFGIKIVR